MSKSSITTEKENGMKTQGVGLPKNRPPTHPGTMLLKEFLEPMEISQAELARALGIPFQRVNEIVRGKRGVTAETALLLGQFFGMSPNFWINAQSSTDLYWAQQRLASVLPNIPKAIELHPQRHITA